MNPNKTALECTAMTAQLAVMICWGWELVLGSEGLESFNVMAVRGAHKLTAECVDLTDSVREVYEQAQKLEFPGEGKAQQKAKPERKE